MTMMIKSYKNDNYYISFEWSKNNTYIVQVCPIIKSDSFTCGYYCGYPIREMTYSINEKTKANNTFNRYIKKYI